jgi:ATP-dependent 26S proteasome regulatory subunit
MSNLKNDSQSDKSEPMTSREQFRQNLAVYIRANCAGLYIDSYETKTILKDIEKTTLVYGGVTWHWDIASGLQPVGNATSQKILEANELEMIEKIQEKAREPAAVLSLMQELQAVYTIAFQALLRQKYKGKPVDPDRLCPLVLVLENFDMFYENPLVLQHLINAIAAGKENDRIFILLGSNFDKMPRALSHMLHHVERPLPDEMSIRNIAWDLAKMYTDNKEDISDEERLSAIFPSETQPETLHAVTGLSESEIEDTFAIALAEHKSIFPKPVFDLKAKMVHKTAALTILRPNAGFEQIGGLESLKTFTLASLKNRADKTLFPKGILLTGVSGCGKAQPLDAKVLTVNGFKYMRDIKVGDRLPSPTGGFVTVEGIFPQGVKPIYSVTLSSGARTECCDDHLWFTQTVLEKKRGEAGSVKPLHEIRNNLFYSGKSNQTIPITEPLEFTDNPAELPIDPYLLGLLLGDGSFRQCNIRFTNGELDILRKFVTLVEKFGDSFSIDDRYNDLPFCDIRVKRYEKAHGKGSNLREAIKDLGLDNKLSVDKHVPKQYLYASVLDRLKLLQGLIDCDGCIGSADAVDYSTSSKQLADDIVWLARSLGGTVTFRERFTSTDQGKTKFKSYRIRIRFRNGLIPFTSEKHKSKYTEGKWWKSNSIRSVELVGEKECQCIVVSKEDGLYITDDFIVTHNSAFTKCLGYEVDLPVVEFRLGRLLGKWVGESESATAKTISVIERMAPVILLIDELEKALSGSSSAGSASDGGTMRRILGTILTWLQDKTSEVYVVGTANDISSLPPELSRAGRFDAIFFLDYPGPEQREKIWDIYRKMFSISASDAIPDDTGWTGTEIKHCCYMAKMQGVPLRKVSKYIVPVSKASSTQLDALRKYASGRFLDACRGGLYKASTATEVTQPVNLVTPSTRRVRRDDVSMN